MHGRPATQILTVTILAMLRAGCALGPFRGDDPGGIPDGPPQQMGDDAIGPIIVLGEGVTQGIGWRYSVYQTVDGWCTQIEMANMAGAGCGGALPEPVSGFGSVGSIDRLFEGIVGPDVAEVQLETTDGRRLPATLMSLERAGVAAQAFVVALTEGARANDLVVLDDNGEIVERHDVAHLVP